MKKTKYVGATIGRSHFEENAKCVGAGLVSARKERGITLIALIITIVVMLILVAVSIRIALNTGLFDSAGKATQKWDTAQEEEAELGNGKVTIDGKTYESIDEYIESTKKLPEGAGERFDSTKEYSDGTKTAMVPAGFTVSGIRGEVTIDGGLVIYDIPETVDTTVENFWTADSDNDGYPNVHENYNQFVWIPVEVTEEDTQNSVASFYRSTWANNERDESLENSTMYIEPYSTEEGDTAEEDYSDVVESVYNNHGFYIARYEAGCENESEQTTGATTEISVRKNLYPCINTVDLANRSVTFQLCENLYYNSTSAKSMLCLGTTWDSVMDFIKDTYNVTELRGEYPSSFNKTGTNEDNCIKNIYDLDANYHEMTYEWVNTYPGYSIRGANDDYTNVASGRMDPGFGMETSSPSFRPILIIN